MSLPGKLRQATDTHEHRYYDGGKQKQVNQKRNIGLQRLRYSATKQVHRAMPGLCSLLHVTGIP